LDMVTTVKPKPNLDGWWAGQEAFLALHPCPIAKVVYIFSSLKLSFLFILSGNRTTHFGVLILHNISHILNPNLIK
jgi:hypothetical protein